MTRPYTAPPLAHRCKATRKPLADGTLAQCMRRALPNGFCSVHQPVEAPAAVIARRAIPWDQRPKGECREHGTTLVPACSECFTAYGERVSALIARCEAAERHAEALAEALAATLAAAEAANAELRAMRESYLGTTGAGVASSAVGIFSGHFNRPAIAVDSPARAALSAYRAERGK